MMHRDPLQNAIAWNLRRRNEARTKGDVIGVRHFQHNLDYLRAQVAAIFAATPGRSPRPRHSSRVHVAPQQLR